MSAETKFTPGPWRKDGNGDLRGSDGSLVGEWGAGCAGMMRSETSEANGIIRNAAPELYEALNVALGWATGGMDGDWRDCDHLEVMRGALRKARGES